MKYLIFLVVLCAIASSKNSDANTYILAGSANVVNPITMSSAQYQSTNTIDVISPTPMTSNKYSLSETAMYPQLQRQTTYSISDALMALRFTVGLITLTGDQFFRLNVAPIIDGISVPDDSVNISDALVILRKVVGLIP